MIPDERFLRLAREIYLRSLKDNVYPISFSSAYLLYLITYVLANARSYVRVLEIGTGYGFSTLWFAKAIKDSGVNGEVITIELRRDRAKIAKMYMELLGFNVIVKVVIGHVKNVLSNINGVFDVVFIDGKKEEYLEYLTLCEDRLRRGGLLIAHNVVYPEPYTISNFIKEVLTNPEWFTVIVPIEYAGLSISVKRC